jgi:ATP-binding cassette subfamily A (ABC1) protein 3
MAKFGGPIVYLIGFIILFFVILVSSSSGLAYFRFVNFLRLRPSDSNPERRIADDVSHEEERVLTSSDHLRVLQISKTFRRSRTKAVDNISFGVSTETVTLLGPNGWYDYRLT